MYPKYFWRFTFIHDNHKFYARTLWNQNFMNIDFIVISAHKQKTKKSLRDLYKMGIVYL